MPVTTPVDEPTVAIDGLLLAHVPPDGEPLNVIELPTQADNGPDIAAPILRIR